MRLTGLVLDSLNLKKLRFILLSVALIGVCYGLAASFVSSGSVPYPASLGVYVVFIALVSVLSSLFVQYLGGGSRGAKMVFFTGVMPFMLAVGCFMLFVYFPNLSLAIKILAGLFNVSLLYTLLLLNNVLLVVGSRETSIPVYRVALNWVQVVLLAVSLILFTSIFKTALQPLIQVALIMLCAYVFYQYLLWVYSSDRDIKQLKYLEALTLCLTSTLLVGWAACMVLFFATESFLRGIFIASVFLFGLGYIQLYLKNELSRKGIRDYVLICAIFLGILVVFRP